MTKNDFLMSLKHKLSGLPEEDLNERIDFYSEMIDDKIEDGISEERAVIEIGSIDEISSQIIKEVPLRKIVKEKIRFKKKRKVFESVLLIVGSPVWVPILIAILAVTISLYLTMWVVLGCFYVTSISMFISAIGGFIMAVAQMISGNYPTGVLFIGAALFLIGLGILMILATRLVAKGFLILTQKTVKSLKQLLINKGDAQ